MKNVNEGTRNVSKASVTRHMEDIAFQDINSCQQKALNIILY